ncbi:MAG TPA: hypothetical protein VEK08_14195 [Planctomycetota bacterium]|nr:hypothetical protein [Planctomycetota bacterium]
MFSRKTQVLWPVFAMLLFSFAPHAHAIDAPALKKACDKTGNWLVEQYVLAEKSFKGAPKDAMNTAIIINALLLHPRDYKETNGPFVSEPVKYLVSQIKSDGSLASPGTDAWQSLAWTITALKNTKNEAYAPLIEKLRTRMKSAEGGADKKAQWATDSFDVTADQDSLRKQIYHAQKLMEAGTTEVSVGGSSRKWGDVLAENVLKLQAKNGSVNDDVVLTALALNVLNLCYKNLK